MAVIWAEKVCQLSSQLLILFPHSCPSELSKLPLVPSPQDGNNRKGLISHWLVSAKILSKSGGGEAEITSLKV